jgi:Fe-S cluster assembly protein SufD
MAVKIPFETVIKLEEVGIVEDAFLMDLLKKREQGTGNNGAQQSEETSDSAPWEQEFKQIRQQAADWVSRLKTPTKQDEEWRFTDLSSLLATNFVAASCQNISSEEIPFLPETSQTNLVFINGFYSPELSDSSQLPEGVFVGNFDRLPEKYKTSVENYFAKQQGAQEVFTALNTSGFADLAIIWVDANVVVEKPIHLIFYSTGEDKPSFSQPRTLVVAGKGASFSFVEEYIGKGDRTYFTNAVTEIYLQENSQVNHIRLQQESKASYHIGKSAVSQDRDSRYSCREINLGAKLSRHNPEVLQQGEQTTTNLYGLTVIGDEQLADTHSIIALTKPYGTTDQLHKCIVGDRAHAVFNGKVFVPKTAQLTNANQLNRNLLLSSKARIDTKPELQITADNVKCSHGATVSQLEAEEIFYLRSRGLNDRDARHLLIDAFAAEILDSISLKSLSSNLVRAIANKTGK